jgi:hypothetical protein
VTEAGPSRRDLLEHGELVPQGQNLRFKVAPSSDAEANSRK